MFLKSVRIVFPVQRAILRGDFPSIKKDLGDEIVSARNLTFPDFYSHQEHSVTE